MGILSDFFGASDPELCVLYLARLPAPPQWFSQSG